MDRAFCMWLSSWADGTFLDHAHERDGVRNCRAIRGAVWAGYDRPSLADVALVPQVYNARRFNVPLDPFPNIARIDAACAALKAFADAGPESINPQI
jgi:glutathione S-transferase